MEIFSRGVRGKGKGGGGRERGRFDRKGIFFFGVRKHEERKILQREKAEKKEEENEERGRGNDTRAFYYYSRQKEDIVFCMYTGQSVNQSIWLSRACRVIMNIARTSALNTN